MLGLLHVLHVLHVLFVSPGVSLRRDRRQPSTLLSRAMATGSSAGEAGRSLSRLVVQGGRLHCDGLEELVKDVL
jgi:hypothetical protein